MAGPSMEDDSDLKGMSKIFNSRTMSGRANVGFFCIVAPFKYMLLLIICRLPNCRWPVTWASFYTLRTSRKANKQNTVLENTYNSIVQIHPFEWHQSTGR